MRQAAGIILAVLGTVALNGCGPQGKADNLEIVDRAAADAAYQAQYRPPVPRSQAADILVAKQMNADRCRPWAGGDGSKAASPLPAELRRESLSDGDLVEVHVEGDQAMLGEPAIFSGDYIISREGTIKLPFIGAFRADGRTPESLAAEIASALERGEFYNEAPRVSVLLSDLGPVRVTVAGAVFEPSPMDLGKPEGTLTDERRINARGASTDARNLTVALRRAGGVRPDADLSAVELRRGGRSYRFDLRPVIEGRAFQDVMLVSGDEVIVPSRLCFQDELMVPSPISPPGISLFLSNLIQPTQGNAPAAVGREARSVPYGTRMMQGIVGTNCVGGVRATNASRSAALFSRNPLTDVSIVVERDVEDMRVRQDRDDYDPFLLPGDAIACYDSGVTTVADAARILGIVGGAALLAGAN
ncbi:polysaccharide biosynthesis/export family protein [Tropicimonas aquimaris]|uniref:Polysaccharide biosynthesis/export family protein n=1 Tax=Tropicimonas aquimaris TaxID=914152 RepID=A0ABW3IP00_9RHOB